MLCTSTASSTATTTATNDCGLAQAPLSDGGTSRRSSRALLTTVMLEADMASAPNSGRSTSPRLG